MRHNAKQFSSMKWLLQILLSTSLAFLIPLLLTAKASLYYCKLSSFLIFNATALLPRSCAISLLFCAWQAPFNGHQRLEDYLLVVVVKLPNLWSNLTNLPALQAIPIVQNLPGEGGERKMTACHILYVPHNMPLLLLSPSNTVIPHSLRLSELNEDRLWTQAVNSQQEE